MSNVIYAGISIIALLTAIVAFVIMAIVVIKLGFFLLIFLGMLPILGVFVGGLSFLVRH